MSTPLMRNRHIKEKPPVSEPVTHAAHDQWTPIPGTPFEVHQGSGTSAAVYLLDRAAPEIALDVDGPLRVRLVGEVTYQYAVRMHPRDGRAATEAPVSSRRSAIDTVGQMNRLAAARQDYWVASANVVTRTKVTLPGGVEMFSPWAQPLDTVAPHPFHPGGEDGCAMTVGTDAPGSAQRCGRDAGDPAHREG